MNLLSVKNLEVCYGAISALQDVSLDVRAGEIVTLIGSNGAGKTTLLRTISGLLKPAAGEVILLPPSGSSGGPISLNGLRPYQIVSYGISHVPEGRQIFPLMTVHENLLLGAYQRRDNLSADIARCHGLFPILKERQHQKAGTLSGGEQQMLAIGRALMTRPRLLMLDEPSQGIMPKLVDEIFQAVKRIRDAGMTVLIVEQRMSECLEIADRAYILQTGRVLMQGSAAEISANPDVRKAYLGM